MIAAEGLVQIQFAVQRGPVLHKLSPPDVSWEDLHCFLQEAMKVHLQLNETHSTKSNQVFSISSEC